jgi:MOSC domain-containing protein YiiM
MAASARQGASLLQVNVAGAPREIEWQGRTLTTGIFKTVEGPVGVVEHHVVGDVQADPSVHGGPTKAVYAYASEHYGWWTSELGLDELAWGAFGENLTTTGLLEDRVRVGDVFRIGTVELMATEPRMPCSKLAARFQRTNMQRLFTRSGRSGIYFAVHTEGTLEAGDAIELVSAHDNGLTIADVFSLRTGQERDPALFRRALDHPVLADDWKETLRALAG